MSTLVVAGAAAAAGDGGDSDDVTAGGGIAGLAVRVNVLGEGLERTQDFIGGAVMEAEEMLNAAIDRIGMLHCRVGRLEAACGIATPPESPREDGGDEEGSRTARSADGEETMGASRREDPQHTDGEEGDPWTRAKRAAEDRRHPRPEARPEDPVREPARGATRSRPSSAAARESGRSGSKCLPNGEPPPPAAGRSRSPCSPSTAGEDDTPGVRTCTTTACGSASEPPSRGSLNDDACGDAGRGVPPNIGGLSGGSPRIGGFQSGSPRAEAIRARVGAMDLEIRALAERVAEIDMATSAAAASAPQAMSATGRPEMEAMVQDLVQRALREERAERETSAAPARPAGAAALAEAVREEVRCAMATAEAGLRGRLEAVAENLCAERGGGAAQQAAGHSESLRMDLGALQVRMDNFADALEAQRAASTDLAAGLRSVERDAQERYRKLRARLDASFEDTTHRLQSVGVALKAMQAAAEATAVGAPPSPRPPKGSGASTAGSATEDPSVLSTIDQRLSVLEGELSRGRVRASRSHSSSAAAPASFPSSSAAAFCGSGRAATAAASAEAVPGTPRKATVEGLSQSLTTLAKILGLVREGETLGSGDWAWHTGVGSRLEQVWTMRAQELEGLPASPSPSGHATLFDILRAQAASATGAPLEAGATGATAASVGALASRLQDRREAARLQAWLSGAPGRAAGGGAAAAAAATASLSATAPPESLAGMRAEATLPRPEAVAAASRRPASALHKSSSTPGLEQQVPTPSQATPSHRRRV